MMAAAQPTRRLKTAAEAREYLQATADLSSSSSPASSYHADPPTAATTTTSDPPAASHSTSSSSSPALFGSRLYRQGVDDPNAFNAWDHVEPPPEYLATIRGLLAAQAETRIPTSDAEALYHSGQRPAEYWDHFYSQHEHKFFKDRKWLGSEFPELLECIAQGAGRKRVLEVGCGAGNTVFPLMEKNCNPHLEMYACDYSNEAVNVVKANDLYKHPPVGRCEAFVWDLSSKDGPPSQLRRTSLGHDEGDGQGTGVDIESDGLDIICLIFCLSALHPREWAQAALNLKKMLKPGGLILVRDYARYDLPQLRFRKGRMLDDNFYVRGDGTRVYFFTPEELQSIFNAGPPPTSTIAPPAAAPSTHGEIHTSTANLASSQLAPSDGLQVTAALEGDGEGPAQQVRPFDFDTLQMALDRRMLVNRKEDKKMYRSWIQTKLRKR